MSAHPFAEKNVSTTEACCHFAPPNATSAKSAKKNTFAAAIAAATTLKSSQITAKLAAKIQINEEDCHEYSPNEARR